MTSSANIWLEVLLSPAAEHRIAEERYLEETGSVIDSREPVILSLGP